MANMGLLPIISSQRSISCEPWALREGQERVSRGPGGAIGAISRVRSGHWWVSGSSAAPSRRALGKTTQKSATACDPSAWRRQNSIGPGWWSWDVATLRSELGLPQSP